MTLEDELLRRAAATYIDFPEERDALVASVRRRLAWRARHGFKVCSSCGQRKRPAEFQRDSSRADGLEHRCRPCRRAV